MDSWQLWFDDTNAMDGPYDDVKLGQIVEFEIGFNAHSLEPTTQTEKSTISLGNAEYMFVSEVSYITKHENFLCILDLGFKVGGGYRDLKDVSAGSYLIGQATLFVDDENYWYKLRDDPNYPPLVYTWQINRILLNTTPYIPVITPGGNKTQERDASRQSYLELDKTDVWEDGKKYGVFPSYVLHCTLLDIPPKYTLSEK